MLIRGRKGKNGTKKYGRMAKKCELYKQKKTRERNKIKKILKHLKEHPNNQLAWKRLGELKTIVGL